MSRARELGAATEALICAAFSESVAITAQAAAKLLGCDVRTLAQMRAEGLIRTVRRGKLPAYTEADIRAYLLDSQASEPKACPSTNRSKARYSSSTSSSKDEGIMEQLARLKDAPRKPLSGRSARMRLSVVSQMGHR